MKTADDVYQFWFVDHGQEDWFGGKPEFDQKLAEQFAETHRCVAAGEAFTWREQAVGRLAEIIVLDQFSRRLYRGSGAAFAYDAVALALAQEAVAGGHDQEIDPAQRSFLYMPYMHSESVAIHEVAVQIFTDFGNENLLDYEQQHFDVIKRFGRFPKRNAALGRESTPQELAYLADRDDSMF